MLDCIQGLLHVWFAGQSVPLHRFNSNHVCCSDRWMACWQVLGAACWALASLVSAKAIRNVQTLAVAVPAIQIYNGRQPNSASHSNRIHLQLHNVTTVYHG